MEAALSKAAPDCCFKHVSTISVVNTYVQKWCIYKIHPLLTKLVHLR